MKKCIYCVFLQCLLIHTTLIAGRGQILTPAAIVEKSGRAVVLIAALKDGVEVGLGNGFLVTADGVIITNHHVLKGSYPAIVKTINGTIYDEIDIIDFNERQDIAILKIKGFDMPVIQLGNSNNVRVGEKILIIGNPNGLENTIADGLIFDVRQSGKGYVLQQLTAPIHAGTSGGPVLNEQGAAIGIATRSDALGRDLSFSVPINYARGMLDGPVKYSLKEFASIANRPSLLDTPAVKELADNALILEELHKHIVAFLSASDQASVGLYETAEQQGPKFNNKTYRIDHNISSAIQILKSIQIKLNEQNYSDSDLQSMKEALSTATSASIKAVNGIREALEKRTIKASPLGNIQNYASPDWTRAFANAKDLNDVITTMLDSIFAMHFIERTQKENPNLESGLAPYLLEAYENKDKNQEQLIAEDKSWAHLGITLWRSAHLPVVLFVKKSGPADIARIRRGDVLLGTADGLEFKTQLDYKAFLKTTRPGETHHFRISRGGKILSVTVKLG